MTSDRMPREEAALLLGLDGDAGPVEVQRAFLRAARRVHPDVLGEASDARRRAAADAFVRLSAARDALLEPAPARPAPPGARRAGPAGPSGAVPPERGRGPGGSLVLLALLAFLLIALVSFERLPAEGDREPGTGPVPATDGP